MPSCRAPEGRGSSCRRSGLQDIKRGGMDPGIAGRNDASAAGSRLVLPRGDNAASPFDDRDKRYDIMWLQLGFDHQIDMAGRQHAIGIAVAAVTREADVLLDTRECSPVTLVHEQGTGGLQEGIADV